MAHGEFDRQQMIKVDEQLDAAQRASGKRPEVVLIEAMNLWWEQWNTTSAADPKDPNPNTAGAPQNMHHDLQSTTYIGACDLETPTMAVKPTQKNGISSGSGPKQIIDDELEYAKKGITAKIKQLLHSKAFYHPMILEMSPDRALDLKLNPDMQTKVRSLFCHRVCMITCDKNVENSALVRMLWRVLGECVPHRMLCAPEQATIKRFKMRKREFAITWARTVDELVQTDFIHKLSLNEQSQDHTGFVKKVLVVAGSSKIETKTLYFALKYLPENYGLILLGDLDPKARVLNSALEYLMESGDVPIIHASDVE
jgi:hypothetical protein